MKHQRIPYKYRAEGENQKTDWRKTNTSRERGDRTKKKAVERRRKKREFSRSAQLLLSPSSSSSLGKAFLFSLHFCLFHYKKKNTGRRQFNYLRLVQRTRGLNHACLLPTGSLAWASDWAGPDESNPAHAGWARLNPKKGVGRV